MATLRAFYSEVPADLDVASDPVASSLLPLPLSLAVRVLGSPVLSRLAHRGLGQLSFGLTYGVPLRSAAIDQVVRQEVSRGARQLVLLGAGLDARAFRLPELEAVTVFELDHPNTQAYKRRRIGGLEPLAKSVRYGSIDFERQTLGEVLASVEFRPEEPSVWIWEGVTMYLTPSAIQATLGSVATYSAPGSALCMTYLVPLSGAIGAVTKLSAKKISEQLYGMMSPEQAAEGVRAAFFEVERDSSALDWAEEFWPGKAYPELRVWERLLVARRD